MTANDNYKVFHSSPELGTDEAWLRVSNEAKVPLISLFQREFTLIEQLRKYCLANIGELTANIAFKKGLAEFQVAYFDLHAILQKKPIDENSLQSRISVVLENLLDKSHFSILLSYYWSVNSVDIVLVENRVRDKIVESVQELLPQSVDNQEDDEYKGKKKKDVEWLGKFLVAIKLFPPSFVMETSRRLKLTSLGLLLTAGLIITVLFLYSIYYINNFYSSFPSAKTFGDMAVYYGLVRSFLIVSIILYFARLALVLLNLGIRYHHMYLAMESVTEFVGRFVDEESRKIVVEYIAKTVFDIKPTGLLKSADATLPQSIAKSIADIVSKSR